MSALPRPASGIGASVSIRSFENGSIDPEQFDHEAHIFVAWLYLQDYDLKDAISRFCAALRRLTIKLGMESKYHQTLSWFFMILIAERMAASDADDWQAFRQQNQDIFARQPSIVSAYYSGDRLDSALARKQFLLPDRRP